MAQGPGSWAPVLLAMESIVRAVEGLEFPAFLRSLATALRWCRWDAVARTLMSRREKTPRERPKVLNQICFNERSERHA